MSKIIHDSGEYSYFGGTYYDGCGKICPICGGKIKHEYTGNVTSEQMEEDFNSCLWMECIDEGGGTIGYQPICKNINKT